MKIFVNDKVYVQNNDLAYFMRGVNGMKVPSSIFNKVFGDIFIVNNENRYDFVEFTSPQEVEFFKNCDWIVDYDTLNQMNDDEIIKYGTQINEERNKTAKRFNALSEEQRKDLYMQASIKMDLLEYKLYSVRDFLLHRQGHLDFPLPEDVNNISICNNIESKKPSVLKRILGYFK